mgnify:CR=1 FL=1
MSKTLYLHEVPGGSITVTEEQEEWIMQLLEDQYTLQNITKDLKEHNFEYNQRGILTWQKQ